MLLRQELAIHQERIHGLRTASAFADSPDDEGLAAAHVAGGEDAFFVGVVTAGAGFAGGDVASWVESDT